MVIYSNLSQVPTLHKQYRCRNYERSEVRNEFIGKHVPTLKAQMIHI
jgi:hypothetical protein